MRLRQRRAALQPMLFDGEPPRIAPKTFSLVEGLSTANPQLTVLVVHSMFMYARGVPGGPIFEELAGLIDPTPEEPTDERQGINVGSYSDDGVYTHRDDDEIHRDQVEQLFPGRGGNRERAEKLHYSLSNLRSMGFEIVYEGDTTLAETLGLAVEQKQDSFSFGGYEFTVIRPDDLLF